MTLTIVSGAAPGVEQGAIEAAINLALRWQGWASPTADRAWYANLAPIYRTGIKLTTARDPGMVRRLNCQDADGALVFSTSMVLVGVPAFVDRVTEQMQRAFLHVTLNPGALQAPLPDAVRDHVRDWIRSNELARVYVTGPSSDDVPGIQGAVRDALIAILEPFAVDEIRETTRALSLIEQAQPVMPEAPHPFVPGRFRQGDRGGQLPSETCDVCGRDPRNALHRALDYPPEGLDEVQRRQLDASIREAERDIYSTGAVHWQHDLEYPEVACQYDGYGGIAGVDVKASPNRAEVTCTDCRTWFARYPEPPAPGEQTI